MKKIRIAIQSRGRLTAPSLDYLQSLKLLFNHNGRALITPCKNAPVDLLHLRDDDIPEYVSRGVADFGIVGENILLEKKSRAKILHRLGFGACSLVIAVPKNSPIQSVSELEGERIATTYPCILSDYLKERKIYAAIIPIRGSVEITPRLNLADAVCDLTQSGKTLKANQLVSLATILHSEAVLIESPNSKKEKQVFLKRITSR